MKIIVTTSDKYIQYLKGFVYMFNKHWPSKADVTVLGYSMPSFDLPDNFEFISVGRQERYGKDWTSALVPFFKQLPDRYFMLFLEDFYITYVNESLLNEAEKYMVKGFDKIFLIKELGVRPGVSEKKVDDIFSVIKQDAKIRLSLTPHIVRRDYFLKHLMPGKDIWQYERNFKDSKNDGARILVSNRNIVSFSNFVQQGRISHSGEISKINQEDLDVLKQLGVF